MKLRDQLFNLTIVVIALAVILAIAKNVTTTQAAPGDPGSITITANVTLGGNQLSDDLMDGTYFFDVRDDGGNLVASPEIPITNGQSASVTVNNLPYGTYTVTDATYLHNTYMAWTTSGNGEVILDASNSNGSVSYTLNQSVGDLTVTNTVVSPCASDTTQGFQIVVSAQAQKQNNQFYYLNGTYDGVVFSGGEATLTIKSGESKTIHGLPAGMAVIVDPTNVPDFTMSGVPDVMITPNGTADLQPIFTRDTGDLKLSCVVNSPYTQDDQWPFEYFIQLADNSINENLGIGGRYPFVNGRCTVSLKAGDNETLDGLPAGMGYTVTVSAQTSGFTATWSGNTGTISKTTTRAMTATFTRETGDLKITCTVPNATSFEAKQEFTYDIYLTNSDFNTNGTIDFGGTTFTDGQATITLKHGESKTITGIPVGTQYDVLNAVPVTDYNPNEILLHGTISSTLSTAAFEYTPIRGNLTVSNQVVSSQAADKQIDFNYTVTLSDDSVNGYFGLMDFINGVAIFTLKDGEDLVAYDLSPGMTYTVTQTAQTGFVTTKTGDTGTIGSTPSEAVFTNTREAGSLKVSNTVVSSRASDKTESFTFNIELPSEISGNYSNVEFTSGKGTIALKGGDSKTIIGLPIGISYKVTEPSVPGFQLTGMTGDTGTISETLSEVEFINTRETGDLKVSMNVLNPLTDDDNITKFMFTVTLSDKTINGTYGDMTFTAGVAELQLSHNQSGTAVGLPTGITYTVTEAQAYGFTLRGIVGDAGTISTTPAIAEFTNERDTGDLTVSNSVVSSTASDMTREFDYTITLYRDQICTTQEISVNGDFGDMTFSNGAAVFTLKGSEQKTAAGLPTGIYYSVVERDEDGFTLSTITGDMGQIQATMSSASFINTRNVGGLVVSNTVNSCLSADNSLDFDFAVTMGDTSVDGTYGEMTFTNGVATFNLKDGELKTATGLPEGVAYTVTQTHADGFTTSWGNNIFTGMIIADTTAVVTAANERDTGSLTVSNNVKSSTASDKTKKFSYTVTLYRDPSFTIPETSVYDGAYGDMTFSNGVAAFELEDSQNKTTTGLPTGIYYKVEQVTDSAFITTKTGDTGVISDSSTALAKFTNTGNLLNIGVDTVWAADQDLTVTVKYDLMRAVTGQGNSKTEIDTRTVQIYTATGWSGSFQNFPIYDNTGREYVYEVVETVVSATKNGVPVTPKFRSDVSLEELTDHEKVFGIVNTQLIDIPVQKVWRDGKEDTSVEIQLYKKAPGEADFSPARDMNGSYVRSTLSKAGGWKVEIQDLLKYADPNDAKTGSPIEYKVEELTSLPGYTTAVTGDQESGFTITNTLEMTSATVIMVWDDANDQYGKRPTELKVTLSNGAKVTLNAANNWKATIANLPKYANGTEIKYTWTEDTNGLPAAYSVGASVAGTITTITNRYAPDKISISAAINWHVDPTLTAEVQFDLVENNKTPVNGSIGHIIDSKTVTMNTNTAGIVTFPDLNRYDSNGDEITYHISFGNAKYTKGGATVDVDDRALHDTDRLSASNTTETIDVLQLLDVPVTIKWVGGGEPPANEKVTLKRPDGGLVFTFEITGSEYESPHWISKADGWTYTFVTTVYGHTAAAKTGKPLVYTVEGETPAGYTTTVTGDQYAGFVITHTGTAEASGSGETWVPYVYENENSFDSAELDYRSTLSGNMAVQVKQAIVNGTGKWVRYIDSDTKETYGGWYTIDNGVDKKTYYYDKVTGMKATGWTVVDGVRCHFDSENGELIR